MNLWQWVYDLDRDLRESGHGRLADIIDRVPSAVIADENEEVEALVPEGLGLARSLNLPWVEIFLRHWRLQAINGGYATLPEAVDLLEFSHREEHKACPQSVCTVQDLSIAYAQADGPGFAQERLEVSREALDRIDATWQCWTCMSSEHAEALIDLGRPQEALDFLDRQHAAMQQVGSSENPDFARHRAPALIALGRPEEALERLAEDDRREARDRDGDSVFARHRRLWRVLALASLGRYDEAREALLDAELVLREPSYAGKWAEGVLTLAEHDAYENDWTLGAQLERMLGALRERGSVWDAVRVASVHGRLALRRDAFATAAHALDELKEHAQKLRDPRRAGERVAALDEALRQRERPDLDLPDDPQALLDRIGAEETPDAEAAAEILTAARERWPDDAGVASALAGALDVLGREEAATGVLRSFADDHPDDVDAQLGYGFALLADRALDRVEDVARRLDGISEADAEWLRACAAHSVDDARRAIEHAHRVVELDPEAANARRLMAAAAEEVGEHALALEQLDRILAEADADDDVDSDHWRVLVNATAIGDWGRVRSSSAALEIDLPGDHGPVDDDFGDVRVRFDVRDLKWALRSGPVTARVHQVSPPGSEQHAGDSVLFDPRPVDEGDSEEGIPPLFPVIKVLEPGGMRGYALDGVHPGEERWEACAEALRDDGWIVNRQSPDTYTLVDDEAQEELPGLYVFVAIPRDVDDAAAHRRMTELTASWPRPFTWLKLAEAAGDEAVAAEQRALAERLLLY